MDRRWEKLLGDYDRHCQHIAKVTQTKMGETATEKRERMKSLEKDYIAWFEYYFPEYAKVKCAWFHRKMADTIINNLVLFFLAEIYRSGAKSVHVCMGIPLFLYYTGRLNFMLLIGETHPKAKKLLSGIQAELEFNARLRNDYGNRLNKGDWSNGNFFTTDGKRFMALGFDQQARGLREGAERPDYIVVDDVDSRMHVNNDELMRESVDKIMEDIIGCFDEADGATQRFVYANNNFHKNSITNRLKTEFANLSANAKKEKEKPEHHVLTVPAVKDLVTFKPNWPEKATAEYWRRKYRRRPRSFKREYMHMHVVEGKVFKQEDIQWKKRLPLAQYDALTIYGDLSYKVNADYKAMFFVGKKGKEYHVISCMTRQCSRYHAATWLYDIYEKYDLVNFNVSYGFEGLFAMDEFTSDFDTVGEERGYYISVVPYDERKGNKFDRIESMEPLFLLKQVFWNEAEKSHSDQITAIEQLTAFEKGSKSNDDAPDALHGAVSKLSKDTFNDRFDARITLRPGAGANKY